MIFERSSAWPMVRLDLEWKEAQREVRPPRRSGSAGGALNRRHGTVSFIPFL